MTCELCGNVETYNFHHFIPRTLHKNKWFKKRFTKEQLHEGVDVCKVCHKTLHELIPDEKEMGRDYNTLGKLKDHPQVRKYLKWKRARTVGQHDEGN